MKSKTAPQLSLIVPIYMKEKVVERSLLGIFTVLDQLTVSYEVIAVVDGSPDNSAAVAAKISHPNYRLIVLPANKGKGKAIRAGMVEAKGEYVGFIDCGLDINPLSLIYFTRELKNGYDALSASRFLDMSFYKSNTKRTLFTRVFNTIRGVLFNLDVADTQVGLKIYRREVVDTLLPNLEEDGYLIDIEMFILMKLFKFRNIKQIPVVVNMENLDDESQSAKIGSVIRIIRDLFALSMRIGRMALVFNFRNYRRLKALSLNY